MIERAARAYDATSLQDLRDLAVVTVSWSSGLRRAELARLRVEDLDLSAEFDDALTRVTRTKGNQTGRAEYRYVSAEARQHLARWLAAAGLPRGPVFRALNRNGQLHDRSADAKSLHPNQIALIVNDLSRRAGLSEPEVARLSAHSLRIGATQALRAENYASGLIALDMGWGTDAMVNYYNRNRDVRQGAMAQWFRARAETVAAAEFA